MMTCTESCNRWAQWKVSSPERNEKGEIVYFKTLAILCGEHKNIMQEMAEHIVPKIDLRFNFVGAVPDGAFNPQSR
jgi:hypothetical protein